MPSLIKRAFRKLLTPILWDYSSAEFQCARVSYSQFGEDVMCEYFFNNNYKGYYVDVGAFHPMLLSNTYTFYRKGWRGLCIDANPDVAGLFSYYRPLDKFLHSAVGEASGSIEMALFADGAFNCLTEHLSDVPDNIRRTGRQVSVPISTLARILEENSIQDVDFLNIDCEGNDLQVLRSNDWGRWKPKVICVEDHESNWQQSEIVQFLASVGYVLKYRAALSSVFIPQTIEQNLTSSRGIEPII